MNDFSQLKKIIKENFNEHKQELEQLGIVENSIVSRLDKDKPLSVYEIRLLSKIFDIQDEKVKDIFFARQVKESLTT